MDFIERSDLIGVALAKRRIKSVELPSAEVNLVRRIDSFVRTWMKRVLVFANSFGFQRQELWVEGMNDEE